MTGSNADAVNIPQDKGWDPSVICRLACSRCVHAAASHHHERCLRWPRFCTVI